MIGRDRGILLLFCLQGRDPSKYELKRMLKLLKPTIDTDFFFKLHILTMVFSIRRQIEYIFQTVTN